MSDIQKKFVAMDRENIEAYTPKYGVDIILPYIPKDKVIWAPFSRDNHNFAKYLRDKGYKVINSHIDYGKDFFHWEPKEHWDIIIDNPPLQRKN